MCMALQGLGSRILAKLAFNRLVEKIEKMGIMEALNMHKKSNCSLLLGL